MLKLNDMEQLFVSENYENNGNILYLRENLSSLIFKPGKEEIIADKHRVGISLSVDDKSLVIANEEIIDKIADIIVIGYKYRFFESKLCVNGVGSLQKDLLISALISADLREDKRYILSKLKQVKEVAIDGFFNFRLVNLKRKWDEICTYIPNYFSERELKEFIGYLINEKSNRKVIVKNDKVYTKLGERLRKSALIPYDQLKVIKEILLFGATEIELNDELSDQIEFKYIKDFFGDKILFKREEIL